MRRLILFLTAVLLSAAFTTGYAQEKTDSPALHKVLFFYSESCHACQRVRNEVMPDIQKAFFDKITVEYFDIADVDNYKLLAGLMQRYHYGQKLNVPIIFLGDKMLSGYEQIRQELNKELVLYLKKSRYVDLLRLPRIDLEKYFLSFGVLAIIFAGLVDGINPCAFAVIAFFVTFLAFQGYRKRDLAVIGLTFILAVFITYLLVGLGIFRFLYSLNKFHTLSKMLYYTIGTLCFILGGLALYDLWLFKKTGRTEDLILQLPKAVKKRINNIIGLHYRRSQDERNLGIYHKNLFGLVASAFVTGFLVSLLEAVCTGQTYLPTITFVLKNPDLKLRAFAYLLLYNLMFIVPLTGILVFALLGSTSESFNSFIRKHLPLVKASMALLFFTLGVLIVLGA